MATTDKLGPPEEEKKLKLESSEQTSLVNFHTQIAKNKPKDIIQFFNKKDFYVVLGKDAEFIAKEYDKTTAGVKYMGKQGSKVPYYNITDAKFKSIIGDLICYKHYKVEEYVYKSSKWKLARSATPGNYQAYEDIILEGGDSGQEIPITMAIRVVTQQNQNIVGIAFANTTMRKLYIAEFDDNERFANLESAIVQTGTKEVVVHLDEKNYDHKKLDDIFLKTGVSKFLVKKSFFTDKDIKQDLEFLLHTDSIYEYESKKNALPALGCLIAFLDLRGDANNQHYFSLRDYDLKQYMRLDSTAIKALNVISPNKEVPLNWTLYGLYKCKTRMGSRELAKWIRQPLLNVEQIQKRHAVVEVFVENELLRQNIRDDFFQGCPDLDSLIRKFQKKTAKLKDCVYLYRFIQKLPQLKEWLLEYDGEHKLVLHDRFIDHLDRAISDFTTFEAFVEKCIDVVKIDNNLDEEFLLKAEFDEEYDELREEYEECKEQIERLKEEVEDELGIAVTIESFGRSGELVFRCNKGKGTSRKIEEAGKYTIKEERKYVKFTSKKLSKLSTKYIDLKQKSDARQAELEKKAIAIAASFIVVMEDIAPVIKELDILAAFADAALRATTPYVRPVMKPADAGEIILKQSRHPMLELQDELTFIPNNVKLKKGEASFIIITGPNMGGKSTYIRQIGLIVLMAQIGSFVPCEEAIISVRDCILARVGASDSQLRGVSTFMAEMLETAHILNNATKDSLIIIDELGRGTSTYDGFGLAWAISEFIGLRIKAFSLFATHFHELTTLEDLPEFQDKVKNLHVTAITTNDTITMKFEVKEGSTDQSFGINVAKLANFPEPVINLAKRKLEQLEKLQEEDEPVMKKRKTKDEIEGVQHVQKFLSDFCNLPLNNLKKDELIATLKKMKDDIDKKDNPYIKTILQK